MEYNLIVDWYNLLVQETHTKATKLQENATASPSVDICYNLFVFITTGIKLKM